MVTVNGVTVARDNGDNVMIRIGDQTRYLGTQGKNSHTCLLFGDDPSDGVRVMQDGFAWGNYPGSGEPPSSEIVLGSAEYTGIVRELGAMGEASHERVLKAMSYGSHCNTNTLAADDTASGFMDGENSWSEWSECSHNCNGGRAYRYTTTAAGTDQMYRVCNPQPCVDGWENWSQWTPCAVSCGEGISHRTRRCIGSQDACEGEPNEQKNCEGLPCPQCGYSRWQFPANLEEQATTNYIMVKHQLPNMESVSICFSVQNGFDQLHGTVFSYSKGLDSPRGNELLFLGKDITNEEIRLYRRNDKLSIPNDVLDPDNANHFCVVLQAQPNVSKMSEKHPN